MRALAGLSRCWQEGFRSWWRGELVWNALGSDNLDQINNGQSVKNLNGKRIFKIIVSGLGEIQQIEITK
jgi:hypothetical protein